MPIEVAFRIELQHGRVEGAVDNDKLVIMIACRLHAVQRGAPGIHNQRSDGHFVAQAL